MYKDFVKSVTKIINQEEINVEEIEKVYREVDERWLKFHFNIMVGLVVFALIIEIILGRIIINSELLSTSVFIYYIKFLIIPSSINFLWVVINMIIIRKRTISLKYKIFSTSLIFVFISFVLFTVHNVFAVTYFIFVVAVMMTTVYANYRLTITTASVSTFLIIVSEIFIKWDLDKVTIFESTLKLGEFIISVFSLIAFSIVCLVIINFERKKYEASIKIEIDRYRLEKSLQTDELTGIRNRKALQEALNKIEGDSINDLYTLVIVDIDNFKSINDTYGHHLGDSCLIEFAKILSKNSKEFIPYRFAGDEFCLIFKNLKIKEVLLICNKIKKQINELRFEKEPNLIITASFGIAKYSKLMSGTQLFINADKALYKAKEKRNSIYVYP